MLKLERLDKERWKLDGYIGGKRYRKTFKAPSADAAKEYRAKVEKDQWERVTLGREFEGTFTECVNIYLEKGGEQRFLIPLVERWGDTKVCDLTEAIVSKAARETYPGCQSSTIKRQFYVPLNAVIAAGSRAKLCPAFKFEPPKVEKREIDFAEDDWMRAFIAHAHFRIASVVLFMTLTGARVSEACRVEVRDVDWTGYVTLRKTKTGRARRVKCPQLLMEAIRAMCAGKHHDQVVFEYSSRFSVNQAIRRVCSKAGIRYLSSHKCGRHAFAARLLRQGESLRVVQDAGGWSTIKMVAETYGHIEQSHVDSSIDVMGEQLSRVVSPAAPASLTSQVKSSEN